MIDDTIKISELDDGGRLLNGDRIPIERSGGNASLPGSALQGRIWRPNITALTGGVSSCLDGIATASLGNDQLAMFYLDAQLQFWILQAGTEAEDAAAGIVRPDDYADTTNERNWVRVL